MTDRAAEFRKLAQDCLELAQATHDPVARVTLLTMAQPRFEMAKDPWPHDFNAVLKEFNERQMLPPKPDDKE